MNYDVIILGAGASGLMCAIEAGSRGKRVLVLEHNDKIGKKILISGGGRCNFTNLKVDSSHYFSSNKHFCKSALSQFTQDDFISWVKDANIDFYEKTLGQLFCKHSSKEILSLLRKKWASFPVDVRTSIKTRSVKFDENMFRIETNYGEFNSEKLVVATGGISFPKLGVSDFGYKLAEQFGHHVTNLDPALVGLTWSENEKRIWSGLAGVSLPAKIYVGKKQFEEPLLFTHTGISGPSVLKASLYWNHGEEVVIDFLPSGSIMSFIDEAKNEKIKKKIGNFLVSYFPQHFVDILCAHLNITDKNLYDLSKQDLIGLEHIVQKYKFVPRKTAGYDKAEVTRGGVSTKDISSKTMESKLQPGLFFVGEVLDVTGLLGGYNFQWAWSSGFVAGKNL